MTTNPQQSFSPTSKPDQRIVCRFPFEKWVEIYAEAGYSMFPLKAPGSKAYLGNDAAGQAQYKVDDRGKTPAKQGWQYTPYDACPDPEKFMHDEDSGGFGVVIPETVLIIDVDPRALKITDSDRDKGYLSSPWHRLAQEYKIDPAKMDTFIVRTPRPGGMHIYLRLPEWSGRFFKNLDIYPGIDFLTKGAYAVGAGKWDPVFQGYYDGIKGHPGNLAECPPELFEDLKRVTRVNENQNSLDEYDDSFENRRRFTEHCQNAPAPIEPGRNKATFSVAARAWDYGLSRDAAQEIIEEHYNDRAQPPLDPVELDSVIRNAYAYAREKMGNSHPAASFRGLTEEERSDKAFAERRATTHGSWQRRQPVKGQSPQDAQLLDNSQLNAYLIFKTEDYKKWNNPLYQLFRRNLFSRHVEFQFTPDWHHGKYDAALVFNPDTDLINIQLIMEQCWNFKINDPSLIKVINRLADENQYHPIRTWLKHLQWDGRPRIDRLFPYYMRAKDSPLNRELGRTTMLGAIARVMKPGCHFHQVPILEGPQGCGKSRFVEALGGPFYGTFPIDPGNKETVMNSAGKWVIEMAELHTLRRADADALKAFITTASDTYAPKYARKSVTVPRQFIIIGTANSPEGGYFSDQTGNRRYFPIECGEGRYEETIFDRNQLFAEAYARYQQGERWWIESAAIKEDARKAQENRRLIDPLEFDVQDWIDRVSINGLFDEVFHIKDITRGALNRNLNTMKPYDLTRMYQCVNHSCLVKVDRHHYRLPNLFDE